MHGPRTLKEVHRWPQFQSALSELLEYVQDRDEVELVRESVRIVLQELIDAVAIAIIGADYGRGLVAGERDSHSSTSTSATRDLGMTTTWHLRTSATGQLRDVTHIGRTDRDDCGRRGRVVPTARNRPRHGRTWRSSSPLQRRRSVLMISACPSQ